ncbi:MAG: hypothetical protein KGQ48_13165 [Bradyrhizobium sp.]|uniref:hypothetical protein n=1 Tax=Bradyrhizobium sp. TaxID=376 RepID=UPI001EC2E536|nr:hypothetical protein [Bradyrhizobium sp.]MBU6458467.1 hypothetical protein [Bradyrhizobium sp.]MDE2603352.1 hypothetical protein [Bradyrhizobium sp.]
MNEHDRSSNLILGIGAVVVLFFGSMAMVWSNTGRIGSELKAEVPAPHAAPHADATAVLEKRIVDLEAKAKTPPAVDTSHLEAQLKNLGSQLTAVEAQLGSFKVADFDALKTKVDKTGTASSESIKKSIDALQTDIGNLHTRFDQLSQQVASAATAEVKSASTAPEVKPEAKHGSHSKSK